MPGEADDKEPNGIFEGKVRIIFGIFEGSEWALLIYYIFYNGCRLFRGPPWTRFKFSDFREFCVRKMCGFWSVDFRDFLEVFPQRFYEFVSAIQRGASTILCGTNYNPTINIGFRNPNGAFDNLQFGFPNLLRGFWDPPCGFWNPLYGFQNPPCRFWDPLCGFQNLLCGFWNPPTWILESRMWISESSMRISMRILKSSIWISESSMRIVESSLRISESFMRILESSLRIAESSMRILESSLRISEVSMRILESPGLRGLRKSIR